jgi:hypothetical protein
MYHQAYSLHPSLETQILISVTDAKIAMRNKGGGGPEKSP